MAGWASRHGGQKRGGGGGGGGGINPRLAQQQMGLELLRRRGGFSAGSGSSSADLLQQHQQQVQWMCARNGAWQHNGVVPSWMLSRGLEGGGQPLQHLGGGVGREAAGGFGAGKTGGELDGYGMLQTQQVEIDGKLHTMFCLPADSPPRLNLGLHAASFAPALGFTALDYNAAAAAAAARVPERGILGGGPADSRWARPRILPTLVPPLSPRRSRSPYRHRSRLSPARHGNPPLFSARSPSRHFRGRSPRDESPPPRHRGNPAPLQRQQQGLLPRPPLLSFEPHLLPNPMSQQLPMPRQHDAMTSRHDYLVRGGRDLVSPTGRDYLRRSSPPDFVRPTHRFADPVRNGRGILGAAQGTVPRERQRGRSRERNRERRRQDVDVRKHALPLEEAIAAKRTKVADGSPREGEQNGKAEDFKARVDKSRAHYSRMLKEDSVSRKKYEDAKNGRAKKLECLVCGSKNFSDLLSLVTHANQGTDLRKRADHQGFHQALCELLGWNSLASPETKRGWTPPGKAKANLEQGRT